MKHATILIITFLLLALPSLGQATMAMPTYRSTAALDLNGWGFDIGFGQQAYTDDAGRLGVFTPFLFSRWRLLLDVNSRRLQGAFDDPFYSVDLSMESVSPLYKEVVGSYVRFGVGASGVDGAIYEDLVLTIPIALGLQVVVADMGTRTLSYFMDYRFMAYTDYDADRSLPNQPLVTVEQRVLFSPTFNFGIRMTF